MAAPLQLLEPVGSGHLVGGRRGSRSGSKTSLEKTGRTAEGSNEPDDAEDDQWMPDHDPRDERGEFESRAQFLLTVIGYTIGNGTFIHFPLANRNHGCASFIIMYSICMVVFGVPMLYLEMMIGQITQVGPMRAFQLNFPLLQGVGWSVCFLSFIRAANYALLNAYSLEYASLIGVAQRTACTNEWNSPACFSPETNKKKCKNDTVQMVWFKNSCITMEDRMYSKPPMELPALEYFRVTLRGLPPSFDEGLTNNNEAEYNFASGRVVFAFCVVWIFACICLLRRMKWLGKLSLFIVSGAGFLTFAFMCRCLVMERADTALQKFFKINGTKFLEKKAWSYAFRSARTSLSLGLGGMVSMASYNKRSNDAFWDSIIVSVVVSVWTVISSMNMFVILSNIRDMFPFVNWARNEKHLTGFMLPFIYFPEVISRLPFPYLISFLYFGTLLAMGISTFFGLLETPISALTDQFKFCRKHRSITIIILVIAAFGIGLVQCTRVGYQYFYILDTRVLQLAAELMVGLQVIAIACYGPANFYRDISASMGKKVNVFGYFLSPYGLLVRISQFVLSPILMAYVYYTYLISIDYFEEVWRRKDKLLRTIPYIRFVLGSFIFIPVPLILLGAILTFVKHRKAEKPWLELLRPDPMHPAVRYKVPPPLGCIFGLKPIEALPSAMGDDGVVEFPEKGITPSGIAPIEIAPSKEEEIVELK